MTNTAAPALSLIIERDLPHSAEKVWRTLTEQQLIEQWLMKNDFAPAVGQRFNLRSDPVPNWDGVIACEVLVLEPNSRLSYSWSTMGMTSIVTFTLTPSASGTHLHMEQTGFCSTDDVAYKGATWGWNKFLTNLASVAAKLD